MSIHRAQIIDGKQIAQSIKDELALEVADRQRNGGRPPRIDVIRVGDDPASEVYVRMKERAAQQVGIQGVQHHLAEQSTRDEVVALIDQLNQDDKVDGILLQLPLPSQLDEDELINRILPEKDVDGFHILNLGKLVRGEPATVACTPAGVIELIARTGVAFEGALAVVVGRSNIVGKPVSQLLLQRNATVITAHSRTKDLAGLVKQADIVVAAVGRPGVIQGEWIKDGAVVIDVGVNRMEDGSLRGDVDFDEASKHAGFITPVPGGVGPMTITYLLKNTLALYDSHNSL